MIYLPEYASFFESGYLDWLTTTLISALGQERTSRKSVWSLAFNERVEFLDRPKHN